MGGYLPIFFIQDPPHTRLLLRRPLPSKPQNQNFQIVASFHAYRGVDEDDDGEWVFVGEADGGWW